MAKILLVPFFQTWCILFYNVMQGSLTPQQQQLLHYLQQQQQQAITAVQQATSQVCSSTFLLSYWVTLSFA